MRDLSVGRTGLVGLSAPIFLIGCLLEASHPTVEERNGSPGTGRFKPVLYDSDYIYSEDLCAYGYVDIFTGKKSVSSDKVGDFLYNIEERDSGFIVKSGPIEGPDVLDSSFHTDFRSHFESIQSITDTSEYFDSISIRKIPYYLSNVFVLKDTTINQTYPAKGLGGYTNQISIVVLNDSLSVSLVKTGYKSNQEIHIKYINGQGLVFFEENRSHFNCGTDRYTIRLAP